MKLKLFSLVIWSALIGVLAVTAETVNSSPPVKPLRQVGALVDQVQCIAGYTPTIYANGLTSPDGLAFGTDGNLYVVEETKGVVNRIETDGSTTPVISGLNRPEGITFDSVGNLYVVEDVSAGRLIQLTTDGLTNTLATNLVYPEGVVWVADDDNPAGWLYLPESTVENFENNPSLNDDDYKTFISQLALPSGAATRILTQTAIFTGPFPTADARVWSYSGITSDSAGMLYFVNELSGLRLEDVFDIPENLPVTIIYDPQSSGSIFTFDPTDPNSLLTFSDGFTVPEGVRFANNGNWPLYVAEENIGDEDGTGRLSQIDSDGNISRLCTNFGGLEDVILDSQGNFYVSDDGLGMVIKISASSGPEPTMTPTMTPTVTPTITPTISPEPTATPIPVYLPVLIKQRS